MTETETFADLARTPAERAASAVPYGGLVVWGAAEIMHWAAWPGMTPEAAMGAVAAFAVAFGVSARREWGWKVPLLTAAFAAWIVFASARGPLSGFPVPSLTVVWAVLTMAAWRMARRHPAILEAIRWRAARAEWLEVRHRWHLGGSHLLEHNETRLGEQMVIDVSDTGKLASAIASPQSKLPELIAMDRKLPRSRVLVSEHRIAGQVVIDIRDRNPWAEPIPHPAVTSGHEVELAPSPSIASAAGVGQDPATGRVLSLLLCVPGGGRNINIVATIDSGKTVLLNDISEFVTRAQDALQIRINLSDKGESERHLWAPACHLTALGPDQKARALKVLTAVRGIMRWRSQQPKTRANWLPTPGNPHVVLIIDELDALTEVPVLRKALEPIATKGREYGITVVRASQRGTAEDTGGGKIRAVDGLWCLGSLNRSTEAMHAAGELGLRLPDVASYGEGNPGVWIIADKSGKWQGGRAWNLCEPADIARIAAARAHSQPDLPGACKAFLGDEYAALVGSDVYARRAHGASPAVTPVPASPPQDAPEGTRAPQVPAAVATIDDPTERLDWDMDESLKRKFAAIDAKLGAARQTLAETDAMPPIPKVPLEKLKESSEERWRQVGEQAEMSPEQRETLLGLLKAGTTTSDAAKALEVSTWTARTYLQKLRNEGVTRVDGKGRGSRWRLTEDGDSQ